MDQDWTETGSGVNVKSIRWQTPAAYMKVTSSGSHTPEPWYDLCSTGTVVLFYTSTVALYYSSTGTVVL